MQSDDDDTLGALKFGSLQSVVDAQEAFGVSMSSWFHLPYYICIAILKEELQSDFVSSIIINDFKLMHLFIYENCVKL